MLLFIFVWGNLHQAELGEGSLVESSCGLHIGDSYDPVLRWVYLDDSSNRPMVTGAVLVDEKNYVVFLQIRSRMQPFSALD